MTDQLAQQIRDLFEMELEILIPNIDTDLIEEGLLDSLVFVDLIVGLESQFEIEISVAELEFDQFRSVTRIAEFIASCGTPDTTNRQGTAA